jgi:hypothetical protein
VPSSTEFEATGSFVGRRSGGARRLHGFDDSRDGFRVRDSPVAHQHIRVQLPETQQPFAQALQIALTALIVERARQRLLPR